MAAFRHVLLLYLPLFSPKECRTPQRVISFQVAVLFTYHTLLSAAHCFGVLYLLVSSDKAMI